MRVIRSKSVVPILFSLVLVLGITPAFAADPVIFDGGSGDLSGGALNLDIPNVLAAVDFELTQASVLTDVHLDVLQSDTSFIAEFDYFILESSSAYPGPCGFADISPCLPIQVGQGVGESRMSIPSGGPNDVTYWFDWDNPLPLAADTKYWLALNVTNSPGQGSIAWYNTASGFDRDCYISENRGGVFIICKDFDFNFELTGIPQQRQPVGGEFIPLDSTMVLVAGAQYSMAWMIPAIVSAIGIGIVIARKF